MTHSGRCTPQTQSNRSPETQRIGGSQTMISVWQREFVFGQHWSSGIVLGWMVRPPGHRLCQRPPYLQLQKANLSQCRTSNARPLLGYSRSRPHSSMHRVPDCTGRCILMMSPSAQKMKRLFWNYSTAHDILLAWGNPLTGKWSRAGSVSGIALPLHLQWCAEPSGQLLEAVACHKQTSHSGQLWFHLWTRNLSKPSEHQSAGCDKCLSAGPKIKISDGTQNHWTSVCFWKKWRVRTGQSNWNNSLLPPSVLKSSGTKTVLDIEAVNSVLELVIGRAGNPRTGSKKFSTGLVLFYVAHLR